MGGIVAGAIFLLTVFTPIPGSEDKKDSPLQDHVAQTITQTPSPTPIQPKIHIVVAGDTLYSIAKDYYGSSKFWTNLWNQNPQIEDPRLIQSGWEIKLGDKTEREEELSEKLAVIYEEIIAPSPTPTTEHKKSVVAGVSTQAQGAPDSFDEVYRQAGAKYGVPWEILYGLHHMETGGRDGAIISGYGTGAQGPLQFMPGTWAAYGADGNGDGVNDINNAVDAIHGAANYIADHGGVEQGLKAYGGDSNIALNYARSRGYSQ